MEPEKMYHPTPTGKLPGEIREPNPKEVLDALFADGWRVNWVTSGSVFSVCPVCDTPDQGATVGRWPEGFVEEGSLAPTWLATCGKCNHLFQYRKIKLVRPVRLVTDGQ